MRNFNGKFLITAYKSKTIRFNMDEDPLQRRIYFLTLIDQLDIIFSQYSENCQVLLDYPKIVGDNVIEDYAEKAIRNLLHVNIDVHSRRLIAEFPKYGIKCTEKLQSHCANMTFADKSRYDKTFQQVTHKEGEYAINYNKSYKNAHALSVSVRNSYSEDQLMHIFLDNFHQGSKQSDQIASPQAELRICESNKSKDFKMHMLYQFQQETAILKINLCIHFLITFIKVENTQLRQQATGRNEKRGKIY